MSFRRRNILIINGNPYSHPRCPNPGWTRARLTRMLLQPHPEGPPPPGPPPHCRKWRSFLLLTASVSALALRTAENTNKTFKLKNLEINFLKKKQQSNRNKNSWIYFCKKTTYLVGLKFEILEKSTPFDHCPLTL